jgi:hypothetical protein
MESHRSKQPYLLLLTFVMPLGLVGQIRPKDLRPLWSKHLNQAGFR